MATVEVRLIGGHRLEQEVTIPIEATYKGGATQADTIYTEIPTTVTFKPGQTVTSFRIAARNDDVDDDNESVELRFGDLPTGISIGTRSTCDYGACSLGGDHHQPRGRRRPTGGRLLRACQLRGDQHPARTRTGRILPG